MPVTIHGITNCDTMRQARAWLAQHGVPHDVHDYRMQGIDEARLRGWLRHVGWETLLNRAGTTFRKLPEAARESLDEAKAIQLMLAQPAMIKRPVLDADGALLVGFKPTLYAAHFGR